MATKAERYQPKTPLKGIDDVEFRTIDPETVNQESYAVSLRDEEDKFGVIREYNSANNSQHAENDLTLDDLSRIGTIFHTAAEEYQGEWEVIGLPRVEDGVVSAVVKDEEGHDYEISCIKLGIQQHPSSNLFEEVRTCIVSRGAVNREQRERLTKR